MKVLVWNLGYAYGRWREEPGLHDRAWHWIAAVDPDLALLQETEPPGWAKERWNIHAQDHKYWTSALVTRHEFDLRPTVPSSDSVLGRFGSYLATGELTLSNDAPLLVASVHTSCHEASDRGTTGLDRDAIARATVGVPWWNDVAFAGYRELIADRRFLIGGDWNTSRWCDAEGVPTPEGAEFFDRAAAAGWHELSLDPNGREGKTWFGSTNPRTHQPDHVFADSATAASRIDFQIEPWPIVGLGLSDHAPMLIDMAIEPLVLVSPGGGHRTG